MNTGAIHNTAFAGHASSNARKSHTAIAPKTDEALLSRLYAGEEKAFDELVNKHHGALIRMAMGYVADRDAAEEVVQDTWMAVTENLYQFEGRSSLRTWIFGIMIHKAKDRGIRENRHTTFSASNPVKTITKTSWTSPVSKRQGTGLDTGHFLRSPGMIRRRKSCWPLSKW
jgi:hypothetical protein